mgnify:FL=1
MPFRRSYPKISLDTGLYVIRGPRQVGKSSWLKTLLFQVCQNPELGPHQAYYLSCEPIENHAQLTELLKTLSERKYIFLDEVTFVSEWWRSVKGVLDSRLDVTIVLTGSSAIDLRQGADTMPGRWGHGGEYLLMPMGVSEWLEMVEQAGWKSRSEIQADRVALLEAFFHIGGFPPALKEAGPKLTSPVNAIEDYWKWLRGDCLKQQKQEVYLREVLGRLSLSLSSQLSLQSIASQTQMGSHHTAMGYIQLLEDLFAIKTLYAIDPSTGAFRFKKQKKFYFTDPLLFHLAIEVSGQRRPDSWIGAMAEQVAHEELRRRLGAHSRMGYFDSPQGEIDFYMREKWYLEVKWSDGVKNLSKAFLRQNSNQRVVWTKENFCSDFSFLV